MTFHDNIFDTMFHVQNEEKELRSVVCSVLSGSHEIKIKSSRFYEGVKICVRDPFLTEFSKYLANEIDLVGMPPLLLILEFELFNIWKDYLYECQSEICDEDYSVLEQVTYFSDDEQEVIYDTYVKLNNISNKKKTNTEYSLPSELINLYDRHRLNQLFNSMFQDDYISLIEHSITNTLFLHIQNYDLKKILDIVKAGIREGCYNNIDIIRNGEIKKHYRKFEGLYDSVEFSRWYIREDFQRNIVVPILYSLSVLDNNSSFIKILKPLLTDELKNSYSLLFKVLDNFEFLNLVPYNDNIWTFPLDSVIHRGKEMFNILHPDTSKTISGNSEGNGIEQETSDQANMGVKTSSNVDVNKAEKVGTQQTQDKRSLTYEEFHSLPFCYLKYYVETKMDHGTLGNNIRETYATMFIEAVHKITSERRASHFWGFMYLLYITPCLKWHEIFVDAADYHLKNVNSRLIKEGSEKDIPALMESYNRFQNDAYRLKKEAERYESEYDNTIRKCDESRIKVGKDLTICKAARPDWELFRTWCAELFAYLFKTEKSSLNINKAEQESQAKKHLYNVYCNEENVNCWVQYLKGYNIFSEEDSEKIRKWRESSQKNRKRNKKAQRMPIFDKEVKEIPDFDEFSLDTN